MTPSQLKYELDALESFYFTRDTMRFFGDTMKNYGVRQSGANWELYRKRPVRNGLKDSAYFDRETFKRVFPK